MAAMASLFKGSFHIFTLSKSHLPQNCWERLLGLTSTCRKIAFCPKDAVAGAGDADLDVCARALAQAPVLALRG